MDTLDEFEALDELVGRVEITRGANRIDELWNRFAEASFDGGRNDSEQQWVTPATQAITAK